MEKVKVENLTKIFGKNSKNGVKLLKEGYSKEQILEKTGLTVGVNQCSFQVNEGEMFVIMGLSGSGKSTLIRLVNRMIEPTSGNIYIDGEELSAMNHNNLRLARREKMSMVFQNFALFSHMNILENTAYGLVIKGMDKTDAQKKAVEALELVGLKGYETQYPKQLSGGMQQRVGLARALATDTDILIMDEAFSALDPLIRKEMQDELLSLQNDMKKTVLFITHDLNEALKLGDRIAIMKDGEIIQIGTPEEILTNPSNDFVRTFVEDVDRSRILTAENVMIRPDTVNITKHGPSSALNKMRSTGNSTVFVVNNKRELQGLVTAEKALEALKNGVTDINIIMERDIPIVEKTTPLNDLLDIISECKVPISVVENNKLLGIIIRGTVLGALSRNEVSQIG